MSRNFTFGISLSFSFDQEGFALGCVRVCVCVHDKVTGLYLTSVRACVRACVCVCVRACVRACVCGCPNTCLICAGYARIIRKTRA